MGKGIWLSPTEQLILCKDCSKSDSKEWCRDCDNNMRTMNRLISENKMLHSQVDTLVQSIGKITDISRLQEG
jgi:hypothetical protein